MKPTSNKIAYYMPFKPMDHHNPSGDLIIGKGIFEHLGQHYTIETVSNLRARWIYYRPSLLLKLFKEQRLVCKKLKDNPAALWLSYHSYYKAPDLLGAYCSQKLGVPYIIFQGIYSTKRRKKLKTWLGFYLNKWVLQRANLVITNKHRDYKNLQRLLPQNQILFIPPGIHPKQFIRNEQAGKDIRKSLGITTDETVIITAAMFRPGVKTRGIELVIDACSEVQQRGTACTLVIVGDGKNRSQLEEKARNAGCRIVFTGKVKRDEIYRYLSSADIFAFPGIEEGLGMVYLEAQSCGLPAVAYGDWGASEAIIDGKTGLLSPANQPEQFVDNITLLAQNVSLRKQLGEEAARHIRKSHDLTKNYNSLSDALRLQIEESK